MVVAHWPELCRNYIYKIKGTFIELQRKLYYEDILLYICLMNVRFITVITIATNC